MKMTILNPKLLIFVLITILPSCNKDNPKIETGTIEGSFQTVVTSNLISGVLVGCAGVTSTTTSNGKYQLLNIPIGQQTLTASKTGYELFSTTINVNQGGKASAHDHNRPDQLDHLWPVLSACFKI
jgi:hypothetical protein